jgi:hypothetical protein
VLVLSPGTTRHRFPEVTAMHTRRLSTRRTALVIAAAAAATGLVATASQASSSPTETSGPALNRMEHEALRYLSEAREEQAQVLNPREHLGLRDVEEGSAEAAAPTTRVDPCSARLAQAWQDLGHFSDGYESYLLRQPPCSTRPPVARKSHR